VRHHRIVLPNGLRVIHSEMRGLHYVTVTVFVGVGSRYETDHEAGISHLVEHMLFKGTELRPTPAAISAPLDSVGGLVNASTDKEVTLYWAKVTREHVPLAVDLLADILQRSRLRPRDVAKEKNVIVEELRMIRDDPQDWVQVMLDELLWPDQPVGREVAGSEQSVRSIRREDLLRHYNRYYGADNAVISVAGGIDRAEALDLIGQHFGDWRRASPETPEAGVLSNGRRLSRLETRSNEQVNLVLGYPGVSRQHADRWPIDMLSLMLGGGTSSRLFLRIREQLGLAYDIHAFTTHLSDTGSLVIYAGAQREGAERLLTRIAHEIERLRTRRVSALELARAKQYYRGRLWLDLEDTFAVASWFGAQEILQHEVASPEQVMEDIARVTADDILRVARGYLQPECARLAAIGPVGPSYVKSWAQGA